MKGNYYLPNNKIKKKTINLYKKKKKREKRRRRRRRRASLGMNRLRLLHIVLYCSHCS
jgi:hypothetical protein